MRNRGLDPRARHDHSRTSMWGTETAGQRPVLQGWVGVCQAGCPRYQGRSGCPEAGEGGRGQLSWGVSLWAGAAKTGGLAWPLGRRVSAGPQGPGT